MNKRIALYLVMVVSLFFSCKALQKHAPGREVYIQSTGFNFKYGHVVIIIADKKVYIDTSYFPADFDKDYVDNRTLAYNRKFKTDLTRSIADKPIFASLATMPLETLKIYAQQSQKYEDGKPETITIIEDGLTSTFNFVIPKVTDTSFSNYYQFMDDMRGLFPFASKSEFYCKGFYK